MKRKVGIAILGLALLSLYGIVAAAAGGDVENGKKVYEAQKCKLCHSIEGVGNKKNPLDGVGDKLKAEEIEKWIVSPKEMKADSSMKAYPKLQGTELEDLVAYMLSLKN